MEKDELYYLCIEILKKLINVPRFSREEKEAADTLESFVKEYCNGFSRIERIGNNLILRTLDYSPSKATILLNSHIDTVRPSSGWETNPFDPIYDPETDRLYGLGSNDAGASLVSLLGTYLYYQEHKHCKYNLVFVASCEEEVSGKHGIESVLPSLNDVYFAIVGEPTDMNPAVAEKGLIVIDGEVKGKSGHAARDEGINAIYLTMPIISSLRSLKFPKESEWLGPVRINTTMIQAGTQHNVVPDRCSFVVDVRTTDTYTNSETFEIINRSTPDYCTLTPRSLRLNPSHISLDNPVIQRLIMLGKEPFGSPTLSDQALMPWPSVKLGPGHSSRSHSANEYIELKEIREALEIYINILS